MHILLSKSPPAVQKAHMKATVQRKYPVINHTVPEWLCFYSLLREDTINTGVIIIIAKGKVFFLLAERFKYDRWVKKHSGYTIPWGHLLLLALVQIHESSFEINVNANQYEGLLTDHLDPRMKRFYSGGRGLLQGDPAPSHRSRGLTEQLDEDEEHGRLMIWPSQSPQLNQMKNPRTILIRLW